MNAAIDTRVEELTALLAEEERLYGELLRIGAQEQGAILGNDPAWLNSLVAEKERLVEQLARTETERLAWLASWAAAHGLSASIPLSELARHLPPLDAARVAHVRDALLRRVRDVAEMNNRNGQLLAGALRIVDRSIEAYSRIGREGSYQPSGEHAPSARTIVLDRKV